MRVVLGLILLFPGDLMKIFYSLSTQKELPVTAKRKLRILQVNAQEQCL